jgi:hypothetical protein
LIYQNALNSKEALVKINHLNTDVTFLNISL